MRVYRPLNVFLSYLVYSCIAGADIIFCFETFRHLKFCKVKKKKQLQIVSRSGKKEHRVLYYSNSIVAASNFSRQLFIKRLTNSWLNMYILLYTYWNFFIIIIANYNCEKHSLLCTTTSSIITFLFILPTRIVCIAYLHSIGTCQVYCLYIFTRFVIR